MTRLSSPLDTCLLCESHDLRLAVPLAPIPIATPNFRLGRDPLAVQAAREGVPLDIVQCRACGHLQVSHIGNPELQYRDYVYTTSLSLGLTQHFARYAAEVVSAIAPPPDALVVELGSNDGTLLRFFREHGLRPLGVDPARRIAETATANGIPTLPEFFSHRVALAIRQEQGPATIVIANNMIANVGDLNDYARGVETLLAPDGVFVFETQYGADVIERNLLDTVYHEHLSYFLVTPLVGFFARHEMELIDVVRIATKGGSIRVTVQRAGGPRAVHGRVAQMIADERERRIFEPAFFAAMTDEIAAIRGQLAALVAAERARGKEVAGYGVSVGTTTLLAQFDLGAAIDYLVDDDPSKDCVLAGPGYEIPIVSPALIAERDPGAVVIFAWRYADAIVAKHQAYLARGGAFIVPLPAVRVIAQTGAVGAR